MMSTRTPPRAVRTAFLLWMAAIAAGVFETGLVVVSGRAGEGATVGVLSRVLVFALATVVAFRMRSGRRWARTTLTVGLGVLGLASLVVAPAVWLLAGNSVLEYLSSTDVTDRLFLASRCGHVVAVLAAVPAMYVSSASMWFRRRPDRLTPTTTE